MERMIRKILKRFFICAVVLITFGLSFNPSTLTHDALVSSIPASAEDWMNIDRMRRHKTMKILREKDRDYLQQLEQLDLDKITELEARNIFYEIVQKPVEGVCSSKKRIGGLYTGNGRNAWDGNKFVCFDAIRPNNCTIYSFGINNEWSFEDVMTLFGCDIWAYDPSHSGPAKRGNRIHFEQTGLSNITQGNYATFDHLVEKNNHSGREISYLKVDVEGYEMIALPQWIRDGSLKMVKQIALELHMPGYHAPPKIKWLLNIFQQLHKQSFRLISYEANIGTGKIDGYYQYMEVVWMKDDIWSFLDQQNITSVEYYT